MPETSSATRVIRFGVFEVDLRAGELRKNGLKVRLTGQPFQVLAMLLERPGEVVTREDLQKRLWPADTFVDFDHSLNTAINKIREALGDSAENPRFVETMPRRGYRFIAPAEAIGLVGAGPAPPRLALEGGPMGGGTRAPQTQPLLQRVRGIREPPVRRHWLLSLTGAAVVAIAVLAYWLFRPPPPPRILRYTQITNDGRAKSFRIDALPVVVTDGSRLYFTEARATGARSALQQVSASGGETSPVPTPFEENIELADISPNRSDFLVHTFAAAESEMRLWILPVLGGAPHRLGDVVGRDATWSPDGRQVAYAKGNELYVCKDDGTGNRKLAAAPSPVRWPRWSPDGRVLRFTVGEAQDWTSLWEVPAGGTDSRPFFPGWRYASCCGNWTPDGKYFLFQASGDDHRTDIWALREKRGLREKASKRAVQLTAGPMNFSSAVSSLDGKRLFVVGKQQRGELVRYDWQANQFVPYLGGISAQDVDVSRDGQWVAYVSYPEGTLWRSKVDGRQRLQLVSRPLQVSLPRWSPDGTRIAFSASISGGSDGINVIAADGGSPEPVSEENHGVTDPSWSPESDALAFGAVPWLEAGAAGNVAIHTLDLKTRHVSTLPGSEGFFSPHWSPDGRYVLAMTLDEAKLMLFDFSTQKWEQLADVEAAYPNWSRDGKYVYFGNPYIAEPAIYRVRISDRKLELVTTLSRGRLGWNIAGKWTGLAGDDSPLVLRDTGTEEIYALDWEAP
jgi:Tol biopolymer transport system component/DNA-binding winged helix-turn-helix (wHTH) protein